MNDSRALSLRLMVSGERACFRRPEFKADLVSYDVMPPTVGRQLLRVISGGRDWSLERILVCNPIRYGWDRLTTSSGGKRVLMLIDVAYVLEVRTDERIAPETVRSAQAVHLGLSDYPASVELLTDGTVAPTCAADDDPVDLGWMIYDTRPPRARFFRATMTKGAIDLREADRLLIAS